MLNEAFRRRSNAPAASQCAGRDNPSGSLVSASPVAASICACVSPAQHPGHGWLETIGPAFDILGQASHGCARMTDVGLFAAMYTARAQRRLKSDPVPVELYNQDP